MKDIGNRIGICVQNYDFSEPQQGKDICDRIICPLKSSIRRYCNEGRDILTAQDMHTALNCRPVKGTTSSVNEVKTSVEQLSVKKIKDFSSYHNFQYEEAGIRVWKAYGIGRGKKISDKDIYISRQVSTELQVSVKFPAVQQTRQTKLKRNESDDDNSNAESAGLFDCTEPGCNHVFETFESLELHMDMGWHSRFINSESVYDALKREWAKQFTTLNSKNLGQGQRPKQHQTLECRESSLKMGWALSKPKTGSVRFSPKVRKYLTAKFDYGEITGHKSGPAMVATDMRSAKDERGEKLFKTAEWLNKEQIKGFFSRLAKKRRKGVINTDIEEEIVIDNNGSDSDDEEENKKSCVFDEFDQQ